MASIVLVPPAAPPPPRVVPFAQVVSTVTGWDGSMWDITDHTSGAFFLPGVRGLTMAPQTRYSDQAPGLAGSSFRGFRALERPVFWPLFLYSDASSAEWVARDRAFWRIMRPGKTLTWAVTTPGGETRTLVCRFENDASHSYELDPVKAGWAQYAVYLVADEDPFWRGTSVTDTWIGSDPVEFFDPSGSPAFHIASSSSVASAVITNPGDVDAWPVWAIDGPVDSVSLDIAGDVVEVPFEVADGERLVIDTNPTEQVALLGAPDPDDPFGVLEPTDRTTDLGTVDFAPIPADETTALAITLDGAGMVSIKVTPGYWRAW